MFTTLLKLLGIHSTGDSDGLQLLCAPDYWELEGHTDFPTFLHALAILIPPAAFLYLEDGSPSGELKEWIYRNMVNPSEKIAQGSYGSRCTAFHIPLTESTIRELERLSDLVATPELAIHVHVYELGRMILEWHDAFGNPIHIDGRIEESKVAEFAHAIGFTFTKQFSEESETLPDMNHEK